MKNTRFSRLSQTAQAQGCVLQREPLGYSLYSNRTFTQADCRNLDEVADCLAFDPSFGGVSLGIPAFLPAVNR